MAATFALAWGLNVTGLTEMDMATPADAPPRFYPVNFHPEFGYLCPRLPFRQRQRARSACKAAAFGVIVGAIAALSLVPRNQTVEVALVRPSAASSAAAQSGPAGPSAVAAAYGSPCRTNLWPYPGTGCLAQAPKAWEPVRSPDRTAAAQPAPDSMADSVADPTPPAEQRAIPAKKAQKTVKRERRKARETREPDPRSAYAGRFADQRRQAIAPNNGWSGFGGGFGGGWR